MRRGCGFDLARHPRLGSGGVSPGRARHRSSMGRLGGQCEIGADQGRPGVAGRGPVERDATLAHVLAAMANSEAGQREAQRGLAFPRSKKGAKPICFGVAWQAMPRTISVKIGLAEHLPGAPGGPACSSASVVSVVER